MLSSRFRKSWALILVLAFLSCDTFKCSTSTVDPTSLDEEEVPEVPSTHVPKFISKEITISTLVGETVTFPCEVDDVGTFATVWRKGEKDALFANSIRIIQDKRFERMENRSLLVRRVKSSDSGDYFCVISSHPLVELKHSLIVQTPPEITSKTKVHISVNKGQPLSLTCEASGSPAPTITWKRLSGAFPDGKSIHEGGVLYTAQSTRHQAGSYECRATNGVGKDATHTVRVHVNFAPEVEPVSSWVHAGQETSAELTCKVRAHPAAAVTWRGPNGSPISESEHYRLKINDGGDHTLQIRQMMKEDFGQYTCKAANKDGSASANITVSGLAGPVEFKSMPQSDQRDSYVLKWSTLSHSVVIDYTLRIKPQVGGNWTEIRVPADSQQGLLKTESYEITGLEPATLYVAEVTVHNKFGYNKPSVHFVFYTQGAAEPQQHSTDDDTGNAAPLPSNSKKLSSLMTVIILSVFFLF